MTLRRKLVVRYALVAGASLLPVAGLAHHEFVSEPRARAALGMPGPSGYEWNGHIELALYSFIFIVQGAGWWVMWRTVQPIDDFTAMVERVHADNLGETLPRTGAGDELDRLTGVFNDMTRRLDKTFQHTREFALHASHELKTPLTLLRAEFEARLGDPVAPECHACAEVRLTEVDRLARIVDSLTLLSRADVGMVAIERDLVVLPNLICECYDDALVLGEPQNISVTLGACELAVVLGDRNRLRQLLLNLADNAVKYNRPDGAIAMSLRNVDNVAEVVITNTGTGVPPDVQPLVFNRFVRGPEARARSVEGSGLPFGMRVDRPGPWRNDPAPLGARWRHDGDRPAPGCGVAAAPLLHRPIFS